MEEAFREGNGPASGPHYKVFKLRAGEEWVVFFADEPDGLPDEMVGRELRIAAHRSAGRETRGSIQTVVQAVDVGILANAAWAAIAAASKATRAFLRKRGNGGPQLPIPAEEAAARVRAAAHAILGSTPGPLTDADLQRRADGSWEIAFLYRGNIIKVVMDRTGAVVNFLQEKSR